jgi:octaprenyl-diphosphate synthase
MNKGNDEQAKIIRQAIESGGLEQLGAVLEAIESTGAITYTEKIAQQEADNAIVKLVDLPDTQFKQALFALAKNSVNRAY